jgi:hypothetical protein
MRKREIYFRHFSNKNLKKRYPRKDFSEILPLKRMMGIPFLPQARRRFGQSSVSAMRRSVGRIFLRTLRRMKG